MPMLSVSLGGRRNLSQGIRGNVYVNQDDSVSGLLPLNREPLILFYLNESLMRIISEIDEFHDNFAEFIKCWPNQFSLFCFYCVFFFF